MKPMSGVIHLAVPAQDSDQGVPLNQVPKSFNGVNAPEPVRQMLAKKVGRYVTGCRQLIKNGEAESMTQYTPIVSCERCKNCEEFAEIAKRYRKE